MNMANKDQTIEITPQQPDKRAWMFTRDVASTPLTTDERERAYAISIRLRHALTQLLAALPRSGASALSLSRDLGIDRNLCRRLCSALETGHNWIEMLKRLPGPGSLRTLINASDKFGAPGTICQRALNAVDVFEKFIWDLGASQTRLNERLTLTGNAKSVIAEHGLGTSPESTEQKELFEIASRIKKSWMDVQFYISLSYLSSTPGMISQVSLSGARGLHGHMATFPIVSRATSYSVSDHASGGVLRPGEMHAKNLVDMPAGLLTEFSTKPFPKVTTETQAGQHLHLIDTTNASPEGIDLFFKRTAELPDPRPAVPELGILYRVRTPARTMHVDVFIHQNLPVRQLPDVRAIQLFAQPSAQLRNHWYETLPGSIHIEDLGRGLEAADTDCHPRYRDLCECAFAETGQRPEDFALYRYRVQYPYWGATYATVLDLEQSTASPLNQPNVLIE